MARPLRPETIEALAVFAGQAGLLAATIIRQQPANAHTLAFNLFYTVMAGFSQAVETGTGQLRESKAYDAFNSAWRNALKKAMTDLVAPISNDHPSLN
jgi:hypothetical protein